MHIPRCQHLRVNGTQCGSPALRGNRHCYFHSRHQLKPAHESAFDFPTLEDANAIQVALMQVIRVIADNKIECKRAGLLLYALQTASYNLKRTKLEPDVEDIVLDTSSLAQEITPPPDPADAIRAMRRTYWKLRDPALIQRDQEIVARECSRATAKPVSPTPVWPGSPARDSAPPAAPPPSTTQNSELGTRSQLTTQNSQLETVLPPTTQNSELGTRSQLTTDNSQPDNGNSQSPDEVDPVLQFLSEMRRAHPTPPDNQIAKSPDEDDSDLVSPEVGNIVTKFLSLLTREPPDDQITR